MLSGSTVCGSTRPSSEAATTPPTVPSARVTPRVSVPAKSAWSTTHAVSGIQ